MQHSKIVSFLLVALPAFGCSGVGGGIAAEDRGSTDPIIGGEHDEAHDAVVLIDVGCTGTIVQAEPERGIGYVLTAAHCIEGGVSPEELLVLRGARPNPDGVHIDADAAHAVLEVHAIDEYFRSDSADQSPAPGEQTAGDPALDFALLVIDQVDADTPVIPILSPADDVLEVGDELVSVGYGRAVQLDEPGSNIDGHRRAIALTIAALDAGAIEYDQVLGGICKGDSGGPALTRVAGEERVAGVHSRVDWDASGDATCAERAFSGRVSSVYDAFIRPILGAAEDEATAPGGASCSELGYAGTCVGNVLVWSEAGACRVRDCKLDAAKCGWQDAEIGYACLGAPGGPSGSYSTACESYGYAGACMHGTLVWVEDGQCRYYDCRAEGLACGWDDGVGFDCLE